MRSGTQTFLFLERFSRRILYFYNSAAPKTTGWMVFMSKAVAARRLDLKRRWNRVVFYYSKVTKIPYPKSLALFNLLMVMEFWTMYPKALITEGTEMPWKVKGESSHLVESKGKLLLVSFLSVSRFPFRTGVFLERWVTENPGKGFQPLTDLIYANQPVLSLLTEPTIHSSTHNLRIFNIWVCDIL